MSDKQMYDILGKFNNLDPELKPIEKKTTETVYEKVEGRGDIMEAVKSLEEKYMGWKKTVASIEKGSSAEDPEAVAASIGRKKYGKAKFQKAAAAGKKLGEAAKPDFLDLDKDGDKKEPMKKATKDAKKLKESEERPYVCVHAKKGKCEVKGTSSYDAAKKAAAKWGLKSTAGIDAHLADTPMSTSQIGEGREFKTKDEFDSRANVGDYYYTSAGNKVTKTAGGVKHEKSYGKDKDDDRDDLEEVAPPGAKAERMVKHIKKGYAKDGELTKKEKSIAYATAWKAKKAGKVEETTNLNEGHIRNHPIYTTQEAWDHYAKELAEQESADIDMEESMSNTGQELDEIAALAGIKKEGAAVDAYAQGHNPAVAHFADKLDKMANESKCMECGMYESKCSCDHSELDEFFDNQVTVTGTSNASNKNSNTATGGSSNADSTSGSTSAADSASAADADSRSTSEGAIGAALGGAAGAAIGKTPGAAAAGAQIGDKIGDMIGGSDEQDKELDEGALKKAAHEDAETMSLEAFCNKYQDLMSQEDCEEFWHNINDDVEEGILGTVGGAMIGGALGGPVGAAIGAVGGQEATKGGSSLIEKDVEEGNEFTKARLDAIKAGKETFTVGGKTFSVTGDTEDEKSQVDESLTVSINATDEDVVGLIRKLAGIPVVAVAAPHDAGEELEEERDIEYANTPAERVAPISAAIPSGTDLHKSKVQDPHTANKAANPLAEDQGMFENLWKQYKGIIRDVKAK